MTFAAALTTVKPRKQTIRDLIERNGSYEWGEKKKKVATLPPTLVFKPDLNEGL